MPDPIQLAHPTLQCKCCGGRAPIFGVVDFVQNMTSVKLEMCGVPVYYHRCANCGYLFTTFFDNFTNADFSKWIYNEQYGLVDLGYGETRARDNCKIISEQFPALKQMKILDYGGGTGKLAQFLKANGFVTVDTYDPFVPEHSRRPEQKYDLVTAFEVVEHTTKPMEMFTDLISFLAPEGLLFFSTELQPFDILTQGTRWVYLNPRAGHASTYTPQAITSIINPMGLTLACFSKWFQAAWRGDAQQVPQFARHLIRQPGQTQPGQAPGQPAA
jgi:2-polyprenyl-6-hydroxyphenyl methylase/3-demethylubiquinone-9 3-methyltransferase